MATRNYRVRNPVLDILRIIRDATARGEFLTGAEIFGRLDERMYWYGFDPLWSQLARPDPQEAEGAMADILDQLIELGLICQHSDREESSGFARWRAADTWRISPDKDGGGGDPPPPGDAPAGGGPVGGGGGGLREALSHPVLFAMDRDDFENLIDGLFEDKS